MHARFRALGGIAEGKNRTEGQTRIFDLDQDLSTLSDVTRDKDA
jgi:hypothetical protein